MRASPRRSRRRILGGLLLAALSIAAVIAIDPAEGGLPGTVRVWAIGTFVAGLVVTVTGALPSAPAGADARPRPRLRGVLLAGTAAFVVTLKVGVDRESSWLTVLLGTSLMTVGVADVVAEHRRARTAADSA
ncbi:hypothetical protein [Agrococcus jenensis]|uniref:Uncharacterized protein n=1 Tax=Agrococcus jenensis TaxID=46353 RepID=A0A3N2AWD0_9MICO|nr:hypothetical protein [Agrococcus jenensis]ROR67313.1 hypothetical protein EDD26_2724 [Agrococcus jenensis]